MRHLFFFLVLTAVVLAISSCSYYQEPAPVIKIAFIGDQGITSDAKAVLGLIRDENTDMVLHQGDFDYQDDPNIWAKQIDDILGPTFPYFASIGNHDKAAWVGYQSKLQSRLNQIEGADCTGDLGVNSACTYKRIFFLLSGIGTLGSNHTKYMRTELKKSDAIWKICSWHKNQRLMQVGGKSDGVGWSVYEECRSA